MLRMKSLSVHFDIFDGGGAVHTRLDDVQVGELKEAEVQLGDQEMLDTARGEIVEKPSWKEVIRVCCSPQTVVLGACYFCTFGAELSINSTRI